MNKAAFGEARQRFLNREPVQCSERVRELARQVLEQRERERENPEHAEQWAKRLMDSMYGEGWDG